MAFMVETATAVDRIRAERVVAILRRVSEPERVVEALAAGGIRVIEVTLDSDRALETIERLRRNTGGVDASNALAFLEAGAVAVGVGSALSGAVDVEAEARRLVAAVAG